MNQLQLALIQTDAGPDLSENLAAAESLVTQAANEGAKLVLLPENFHLRAFRGAPAKSRLELAEPDHGPINERLRALAAIHKIYLLAGSYNQASPTVGKMTNTSLLFGPNGDRLARYDKIHLFDANIGENVKGRESAVIEPGNKVVTAETTFGTVGLTICYDLRFPELYRALAFKGAIMTFAPANFTLVTGKDHWEPLLRARAIENGMYMVAPGQIGGKHSEFESYGHSMVVDPWGTVVACSSDSQKILHASIDLDLVEDTRTRLPSLKHVRPQVYMT